MESCGWQILAAEPSIYQMYEIYQSIINVICTDVVFIMMFMLLLMSCCCRYYVSVVSIVVVVVAAVDDVFLLLLLLLLLYRCFCSLCCPGPCCWVVVPVPYGIVVVPNVVFVVVVALVVVAVYGNVITAFSDVVVVYVVLFCRTCCFNNYQHYFIDLEFRFMHAICFCFFTRKVLLFTLLCLFAFLICLCIVLISFNFVFFCVLCFRNKCKKCFWFSLEFQCFIYSLLTCRLMIHALFIVCVSFCWWTLALLHEFNPQKTSSCLLS